VWIAKTHEVVHVSENKTFPSPLKLQGKMSNPVDILSREEKKLCLILLLITRDPLLLFQNSL